MWKRACLVAIVLSVPCGRPLQADDPNKEPTTKKAPTFKVPKGWETREPDKLGIVTARFRVGKDEKETVIVVVGLTGEGGGLVANINRWRGVVGLESLDETDALKLLEPIKVDNLPAHRLDVTGPARGGKPAQRAVAVVVKNGDMTWYIKMGGAANALDEQKDAFDAFVKSIHFEK